MVAVGPGRELNGFEGAPGITAWVDDYRIDGKSRTIRELFTDGKYRGDYYQREYAWTQANVSEFLDDLSGRFAPLKEERPVTPGGRPNGKVTAASATFSADGSNGSLDVKAREMWLWDAACQSQGPLDTPKFKDYILPLIFLKYLSDVFDDEVQLVVVEVGDLDTAKEIIDQDHALVRLYVPAKSRWPRALSANRHILHGVSECA